MFTPVSGPSWTRVRTARTHRHDDCRGLLETLQVHLGDAAGAEDADAQGSVGAGGEARG